jgi:hypothetical protein
MVEVRAAKQRPVRVEPEASCGTCRQSVILHGALLRVRCDECGEPVELSSLIWTQLFRDIDEQNWNSPESSAERQSEQTLGQSKLRARWKPGLPTCAKCSAQLLLVDPGTDDKLECMACRGRLETFPAPAWLRTELPTAMQLYGAAREHGDKTARREFWITFQGTPPALNDQRQSVIQAAIGTGPLSQRAAQNKKKYRWELFVVLGCVLLIGVALNRCSRKLTKPDQLDDRVESTQ